MKLVIAEALPVHVHKVSDVRHVQSGGGGGVLGDHGGGKEGGREGGEGGQESREGGKTITRNNLNVFS